MTQEPGVAIIGADTILKGDVSKARRIEVHGYVEGEIKADMLLVHEGGRVFGNVRTDQAEVRGVMQGTVTVRNLISIASTGSVSGNVRYGQLALAAGGDLSADVRNMPPELAGDLSIAVRRGRSVPITTEDLTAFDPDDSADSLTFSVSNASHGFIALAGAPAAPVSSFTQADLARGNVLFVQDGSDAGTASFDVIVADKAGATSGTPQTVKVAVIAAR